MITPTDISTAASRVLAQYDFSEAYLFGSFARGEQTPNSDIDLRLVCGNAMTFGTLYELSHELERELGRKVEIVTNPPEHMRPAFRKSIKQEEIRLYVST
ncbi:nucleotidyltransferase family protein [Collinsella aerofaciens]|uniref:nucleotidyltransferase family protein n=1 Tax=Collinsella aerofaciens TaxID=74426 RepID=UPI001898B6C1|nr:nucleotidyltransferase domain-containing protein [Collinsella aerofaciens]MDB1852299.1 nucleotidyltransferase domain-containing protein [Collinsella aerofaciens]